MAYAIGKITLFIVVFCLVASLGIKATKKNKEQEKAYVNKIAKYEKEIVKEMIVS